MTKGAERFLDVTGDVCPMTFVRTRLLLDAMAPGEVAEIRLAAGEPLANVPRSALECGHAVLSVAAEEPERRVWRVRIERR